MFSVRAVKSLICATLPAVETDFCFVESLKKGYTVFLRLTIAKSPAIGHTAVMMKTKKEKSPAKLSEFPAVPIAKRDRTYTASEERLNVVTHAIGALFGIFIIVFGIVRSVRADKPLGIPASIIFGVCMIITYGISAVYHGLKPSAAKRVLRTIDHCTVYILIVGTYTALMLAGVYEVSKPAALAILAIEWGVGALAITLTAVNMKKYMVFSMICYIALGWCIMAVPHIAIAAFGLHGFLWLSAGGLAYTVGSVLYGIGKKTRHMHGVFHIFCLVGSGLQFVCFAAYCL